MGISLKDQRRRGRRRSYGRVSPPGRDPRPRSDPFRIFIYLVLIAGLGWVYFNQETVKAWWGSLPVERPAEEAVPDPAESSLSAELTPEMSAAELVALADEAYRSGNLAEAIDFYRQAAEREPGNADYQVEIARLLIFEAAMQIDPERQATLGAALEAANAAVLADPLAASGYAILGKVYDWQNRPDQASSTILQAIEIDENYALAHSYMAEALIDLDRWDQATESIQTALELEPDHVDIRRDYGYVLENLGSYAEAATQYELALTLHPRLTFIRMSLARTYRVIGRYDEAIDQLFEAQAIMPSSPMIPFEIGRTYETYIGDPDSALEYYERAVDLVEDFGPAWMRIGTLNYFLGSYEEAVVALERALSLNVAHPDLYYQLGLSYAYQGNCPTAIRYLDEAQRNAGGDERIQEAVLIGYEYCSQPTPVPVDVLGTPTVTPSP